MSRYKGRLRGRWYAVAVVGAALLAVGFVGPSVGGAQAATTATPVGKALGLKAIPKKDRAYYDGYNYFAKLFTNPYANWTPPKPPWKFCYNESYLGNSWRQESLATYERLVTQLQKVGLASGPLSVTNSDNNVNVQLSQLESQVRSGCNVIISIPGSPTALNKGIEQAYKKGILFISDESPVYSPLSINVTFNDYWDSYVGAEWVAKALHGKGNVLDIQGIPGLSDTVGSTAGVHAALKKFPGIKLVGEYYANWTPSIVKSKTLQWLSTHPGVKVDGVIDNGQSAVGAEQALQQSGRPLAVVNSFSGEAPFFAFVKQNNIKEFQAALQGGGPALYEAFHVALRMLNGQKPIVNTLMYPIPLVTQKQFKTYYKPSYTLESTLYANPPDWKATPDSYFNALFKGGKAVKTKVKPAP